MKKSKTKIITQLTQEEEDLFRLEFVNKFRKFEKSLTNISKQELVSMLCHHFLECEVHKEELAAKGEMIRNQSLLIKILKLFKTKTKADTHTLRKKSQAAKNLEKHIDYLDNILGQRNKEKNKNRNVLVEGRKLANQKRSSKSQVLNKKLESFINDYLTTNSDRKVGNKEIVSALGKSDFMGDNTYTDSSLSKKVAITAARIRHELSSL